jgi:DNA-binding IclR family transcriptional regulator
MADTPFLPPGRPQVPAADQTLRILSFLARQRGPVPARTVATGLGIPRSSVYHLLATLHEHQFVVHLPEEQRWGLGIAAFELAGGYSRQQPLARLGRPVLADLVDRAGESAHLAATGRAMLAALPREQVRALFPDAAAFSDRTGRGPDRPGELRELLREVRARGWAFEDGEVTLGLGSVGVAVLDHVGWPIAAIAVTYPADGEREPADVAALLAPAARELERRIRGTRPAPL